jgi:ATP-dependent Clp protease ATP-binding subunit ClpC
MIGQGDSSPSGHVPFTPRAKKVLELALREALQLGHNYIGTEHVLLGLLQEGEGVACQVLVEMGVNLPKVRARVLELVSVGGGEGVTAPAPPLSAELEAVIEEARGEGAAAGESEVAPIHLFLAAVEHPEGAAGRMLHVIGVDPVELRRQVIADPDDQSE